MGVSDCSTKSGNAQWSRQEAYARWFVVFDFDSLHIGLFYQICGSGLVSDTQGACIEMLKGLLRRGVTLEATKLLDLCNVIAM